jgi:poly(3-hydroxybutyrate) depolymerase
MPHAIHPNRRLLRIALIGLLALAQRAYAKDAPLISIPTGVGHSEIEVNSQSIEVFTFKAEKYDGGPLIVACHGKKRGAELARDNLKPLADKLGAIVVAPLFDDLRFPQEAYQRGGITKFGRLQESKDWTVSYIDAIVAQVRLQEGNPKLSFYLLGHSAGGQFLERLAAIKNSAAVRIVAANPGSHIFPTRDVPYPHGFGGLPEEMSNDEALKRYLAQPLTIYLGSADLGDKDLPDDEAAVEQGATRYERGKNCFRFAEDLAKKNGWPFHWRLVEAPDVNHSAKAMYEHPRVEEALASP